MVLTVVIMILMYATMEDQTVLKIRVIKVREHKHVS